MREQNSWAEALKTNSSLAYLNLEGNEIGAEGAKLIGEALKTNSSLTNLELWNNQIGDEGSKTHRRGFKDQLFSDLP